MPREPEHGELAICACPLVRGEEGAGGVTPASEWSVRRILVPIDYSDNSRLALHYAASLVRHFGAPLTLIHVEARTWRDADLQNIPLMPVPEELPERTLNDLMKFGCEEFRWAFAGEFEGTAVARRGAPGQEIVAAAVELGIALIAMSSKPSAPDNKSQSTELRRF